MRFASPFQVHAVLQRDQPIPVWGWAGANEEVVVQLGDSEAKVMAAPDGRWLVRLPSLQAGGPYELLASSASGEARLADILVGEVWICSGQSNMGYTLVESPQAPPAHESDLPRIRLLTVSTQACQGPQTEIYGKWAPATHASFAAFSAVGGWFGRRLHCELGVPVGLICNAWGGTRVQAWMSREALMCDALGVDEVRSYENYAYRVEPCGDGRDFNTLIDWERYMAALDTGNASLVKGWAAADFADQAWETMRVPGHWQDDGHPGSGVYWFRRTVQVPAGWRGHDLELHLGAVDKHDDTYVNGERVGGLTWTDGPNTWNTPRVYRIPSRLVGASGAVCIAVRARSHLYDGGLIGPAETMRLHPVDHASGALALHGEWRYACEQDWGVQTVPNLPLGPGNPNAPYTMFDSRLAPLIPYGIRGFIWYQGESNAHEAGVYRQLLPQMIRDWRRAFGQGNVPFLQVQLANFGSVTDKPGPSDWALLREAQTAALCEPATGMAVAIDVGEGNDIHPRDKHSVGERLARWALAETYGRGGMPSGPLYAGMTIESGNRLRIRFRHADGLKTRDGEPLQHIAIAGIDRNFQWAMAAIEGDTLVVWHPEISRPAAVRYAWANNPEGCNLVNGAGLPALPFRTDSW
ncbi:MAG: sialate O-acetylesterase [bacterium]